MNRRNLLLGIGSATAGSALLGSGAVTEMTADSGIAIQVSETGLIDLQGVAQSVNSAEHFDAANDSLDLGATSAGAQGLNYDSVNYFDDVFQVVNQAANKVDIRMPVDNSGDGDTTGAVAPNIDGFNLILYLGERDKNTVDISQSSPLTLPSGTSRNIGVEVEVPPRSEFPNDQPTDQVEGEITLDVSADNAGQPSTRTQRSLEYDTSTPKADSNSGNDVALTLDSEFDEQNGETGVQARIIRVRFENDALQDVNGDVAGQASGGTINVLQNGQTKDVSDVTEQSSTSSSAAIDIEMANPIEKADSPPESLDINSLNVKFENRSATPEIKLELLQRSGEEPFAATQFKNLQN